MDLMRYLKLGQINMCKKLLALISLTIVSIGFAVAGEEPPAVTTTKPPELKFAPQLARVDEKAAKLVGADRQKELKLLAEAAVLSDYCAAINLDQTKFKQKFNALTSEGLPKKPLEQQALINDMMTYFGVYVGLFVAEGADTKADFCGFAESAMKENRPISAYWTATGAKPPEENKTPEAKKN
jgi:hypothetical protein